MADGKAGNNGNGGSREMDLRGLRGQGARAWWKRLPGLRKVDVALMSEQLRLNARRK